MRLIEISSLPYYDTRYERIASKMLRPDLTDREAQAIEWWRGHGYSPVNSALRGIDPEWPIPSDEDMLHDYGFTMSPDEALRHLDAMQSKAPKRKRTIKVFRGERSQERTEQFAAMKIGESYVEHGFTSASVGPSYAFYYAMDRGNTNALSMILVPPSVRAAYVADEKHTEMEVLIDRDTRFTLQAKRHIPNRNPNYRGEKVLLFAWVASPVTRS